MSTLTRRLLIWIGFERRPSPVRADAAVRADAEGIKQEERSARLRRREARRVPGSTRYVYGPGVVLPINVDGGEPPG
ncbi:hypothetical protein [Rhizohabitans arisaemae]|uniref:hypothetical protein n=1 Tax=Rhizohabitans arisaemae TaxID=2720610 RepID=UPI0024B07C10|nr:hypothetical protein [Rhizohabitans arisaemae]